MPDLSVLIPARNEMFLGKTIESVLSAMQGDTEVIAVADGDWPVTPIPDHPKVHLITCHTPIGQRQSTNLAARASKAKYIMKLDAHCSLAEGFDVRLIEDAQGHPDWTIVPAQYNLHAFDWKCRKCGNRSYQGPTPVECGKCGRARSTDFKRIMIWQPRLSRLTESWRFDRELHFQYWREYMKRPEAKGQIVDTMSCLGACWFMERARYWELGGMDERHGSWGQMGTEVACKAWLSGGRLVTDRNTWFAHMFRTQGGDFGFPYQISGNQVSRARQHSKWLWIGGNWDKAVRPLSWLLEKFKPIPDWHNGLPEAKPRQKPAKGQTGPKKGLIYYTDNRPDAAILTRVMGQISRCANGFEITSASLKPLSFGKNVVIPRKRGILTMFLQILAALENSKADIVFFCEHDVLYHPSHFDFVPPAKDVFYYNENTWKVDAKTGQALFYYTKQTSGLCAYRDLLLAHYQKRIKRLEENSKALRIKGLPVKHDGFSRHMGFEPGCHRYPRGVDNYRAERWMSPVPNIDIRHGLNLTPSRWDRAEFRNPDACLGWTLADEVPGWGRTKGRFQEFLEDVKHGNAYSK